MNLIHPKIHLGALALAIAKTCMHEWAGWTDAEPQSIAEMRSAIAGPGSGPSLSRSDLQEWPLLEATPLATEIGNDDLFFWRFRQQQDGFASARLGVSREEGAPGHWWEVLLEGTWDGATIKAIRATPFAPTWLQEEPRRIGLLGQLYADAQRERDTPWGRTFNTLILAMDEWALVATEANAVAVTQFARWDGLLGSGALLKDRIDIDDEEAVRRRRYFVRQFHAAEDFKNTRTWMGPHLEP